MVSERDSLSRLEWIEHKSWIMLISFFIMFSLIAVASAVCVNSHFLRSQPAQMLVGAAALIPVLTVFLLFFSVVRKVENQIIRFFAKLKSRRFIADLRKRLTDH